MIDEILAFVTARLNDDEALATAAAGGGRWSYEDGDSVGAWTLYDEHWTIAQLATYRHETYDYAAGMPAARHPRYVDADANGRHMARHDPARVLREVASKRRVVARHKPERRWDGDAICGWCSVPQAGAYQMWPCPDLRDLASAWSTHPDYRSEWAPTA